MCIYSEFYILYKNNTDRQKHTKNDRHYDRYIYIYIQIWGGLKAESALEDHPWLLNWLSSYLALAMDISQVGADNWLIFAKQGLGYIDTPTTEPTTH